MTSSYMFRLFLEMQEIESPLFAGNGGRFCHWANRFFETLLS